jgi:hypothetical protein
VQALGRQLTQIFLKDGECIKIVELNTYSTKIQSMSFTTSFGRSFSIRGSTYDDFGQISAWRAVNRECILGLG